MKPQEFEALVRAKAPVVESAPTPIVEATPAPVLKSMDINSINRQYHALLGESSLNEFAPGEGGGGDNGMGYLHALAQAWFTQDLSLLADIAKKGGSPMKKVIDAQVAVEKILSRGVHCPDGKVRKYYIDYNGDFDGVDMASHDYYEYADDGENGEEVDSRTGQPWSPYDHIEFQGSDLGESIEEAMMAGGSEAYAAENEEHFAELYSPEAIRLGKKLCQQYNITNPDDIQFAIEIIDLELEHEEGPKGPIDLQKIKSSVAQAFRQSYINVGKGPNFRKKFREHSMAEDEQLDGMALGELKAIAQAAKKIYTSVKRGVPLEAWMYKKITNGNEGLTAVAQQIDNPAVREQQGVAEGDVVAFKRPVSQPKTNQQPQNYHAALELAGDWFWLEQGPMAHEMGTAKERKMQRLAAQKLVALKKLGYSVDWPLDDDDFYGVDLTYTPTKQTWRIDADNLGESMQGVAEMDSQPPQGRIKSDGTRSHSTYGSRDGHNITGPESTGKATTPKKVIKKGTDILDRAFKDADKKGVAEAEFEPHTAKFGKQVLGHGKDWDENPVGPAKWYKVYVSDGKEWSKKATFDHEMAAQRFIHQQVLAQNPNARVGIVDYTMKPGSQPRIVKGMNEQDPNDPNWSQKYSKDVHENTDYATQVNSLLNEMGAGSIASAPGIMTNPAKTGSLFGGSYTQKNSPFKKKSTKKESMIKRDGL